jgi:hypothetical protein
MLNYGGLGIQYTEFLNIPQRKIPTLLKMLNEQKKREARKMKQN